MARVKRADTNRADTKRDIEKHVVAQTDTVLDGNKYDVKQAEIHSSTRFEDDDGSGKEIILRRFEYLYPPGPHPTPTKDEVLTPGYIKFLEATLYMVDNLEMIQEPKLVLGDKGFSVFATCQARKGHIIPWQHKPQTLSDIAHDSTAN